MERPVVGASDGALLATTRTADYSPFRGGGRLAPVPVGNKRAWSGEACHSLRTVPNKVVHGAIDMFRFGTWLF
jgi:hypothetical protein